MKLVKMLGKHTLHSTFYLLHLYSICCNVSLCDCDVFDVCIPCAGKYCEDHLGDHECVEEEEAEDTQSRVAQPKETTPLPPTERKKKPKPILYEYVVERDTGWKDTGAVDQSNTIEGKRRRR